MIVPAYHQSLMIEENLGQLSRALDSTGLAWEVVVVVDGDDETYRAATAAVTDRVRVYGYVGNRGKGFALRYGIMLARGELVTFIDSDMEIGPDEIGRMAKLMDLYDAHVVVGSKRHSMSEVEYPALRRLQSAAYQLLVRILFRVRVRDTQTGLKMMRREVALRILDVAMVKRFAFDLELLALCVHFGYRRIIEAPVVIHHRFPSTTNLRAVFWVLVDTCAIFYRLHFLHWYDRPEAHGLEALKASIPAQSTTD